MDIFAARARSEAREGASLRSEAVGRIGTFVAAAVILGTLGWLMFFIASYSTREGAVRRFFILAAPVILVGGFGGLVVMFRAAFRPPKGGPKTLVGRAQTVIGTAGALIFAIIVAGVGLYLFGLDRDNEVASLVIRSADFLVTPFRRIFVLDNNYAQVGLNWGIGACAYVAAALVLSGAVGALGPTRKADSK